MDGAELARRLEGVAVEDVAAVRLLLELQGETDVEEILERREEIDRAVGELQWQMSQTRGMVERCQRLRPRPSRRAPIGF